MDLLNARIDAGRPELVVLLALVMLTSACAAPQVEVMAIANEGFLVRSSSEAVLVDALFRATAPFPKFYQQAPSENLLQTMINGGGVFEHIDLVLVTHMDADHFHAPTVMSFLLAHPETTLIAPEEVLTALASEPGFDGLAGRALAPVLRRGECTQMAIDNVEVKVCRLRHSGDREVANNLYRVELGGFSFVHEGDAERDPEAFHSLGLDGDGLDLALLHDWFIFSEQGREILNTSLQPMHVVLMHHRWDAAEETRRRLDELDPAVRDHLPEITVLGGETARITLSPSP